MRSLIIWVWTEGFLGVWQRQLLQKLASSPSRMDDSILVCSVRELHEEAVDKEVFPLLFLVQRSDGLTEPVTKRQERKKTVQASSPLPALLNMVLP